MRGYGLQAIPPTLQQSLAARLDRLGEAREVAQIGAVVARVPFARQALPVDRSPRRRSRRSRAGAGRLFADAEMPEIAEAQALMKSLP